MMIYSDRKAGFPVREKNGKKSTCGMARRWHVKQTNCSKISQSWARQFVMAMNGAGGSGLLSEGEPEQENDERERKYG